MFSRIHWLLGFSALALMQATSPLTWAGEARIKVLNAAGEDLSSPALGDDHIVAVLSYERTETTQACGGPMGRTLMKVTVHADGAYVGVETSSRLQCPGSGLVRKAMYSKHDGKLSMTDLARLMDRLAQITGQSRDLAASGASALGGGYQAKIQLSNDLRGVLSERDLPEFVQTGQAAEASARFMQAFIHEGKIN